jgi:hypothetical protein
VPIVFVGTCGRDPAYGRAVHHQPSPITTMTAAKMSKSVRVSGPFIAGSSTSPRHEITCWRLGWFRRAPRTVHGLGRADWRSPFHSAKLAPGRRAMWMSELALLIYLAVLVWAAVAARPLVARYLATRPPGITWQLVP